MNKLSLEDYLEIKQWIHRNAKEIEMSIWKYYFENGSKEEVLSALSFYQNDDGGFGHALEPDNLNPNSSPYTTTIAINILNKIEFDDIHHPIMQGIMRFLQSGVYCSESGWNFNIPSNNDYAHAPWWTYNIESNTVEGIGVTAELVGFIFKNAEKNSKLYKKAISMCNVLIDKLNKPSYYGDMGIGGYCKLLDAIKQSKLEWQFNYVHITKKLQKLVYDSIERDTSKWASYSVKPSNYIKSPQSIFYKDNEDILSKELDYIINTRTENGVWNITWNWNEQYKNEFTISENWWKASIAIDNLILLKNFDRFDFTE